MFPYVVGAAVAVPFIWLAGDLAYSLIVRFLYGRWESGIERDAEGVRLGCREFTLGDGADAVLLIHGFGDSPAVYQLMAPALAAKRFTCHGLRLPFYGLPMSRYRQTSADQWREAARSAISDLRSRHRRVYILAHSLGAAVAVEAVAEPAFQVDGMVLLAPLFDVSSAQSLSASPCLVSASRQSAIFHRLRASGLSARLMGQEGRDPNARRQIHSARGHP